MLGMSGAWESSILCSAEVADNRASSQPKISLPASLQLREPVAAWLALAPCGPLRLSVQSIAPEETTRPRSEQQRPVCGHPTAARSPPRRPQFARSLQHCSFRSLHHGARG